MCETGTWYLFHNNKRNVKRKNIEKIMSRNIPEIMEKISCFLCKKQDKLFIIIGLVCESENRPHSPFYFLSGHTCKVYEDVPEE